jgi:hypothetical protein
MTPPFHPLRLTALVTIALVFGAGCKAEASKGPSIATPGVVESSGLVLSRSRAGVLWTHNDSGSAPWVYGIDEQGHAIQETLVEGADAVDWEDIAIDDHGNLYVADFGNNKNRRKDLRVFVVPEPTPEDTSVRATKTLRFRYGDQTAFPPNKRSFDAESLFWHADSLWLFTKHRDDSKTKLYRFESLESETEQVLHPLGELELGGDRASFGGMATAADVRSDGMVALLTYHAVFLIPWGDDSPDLTGDIHRIDFDPSALGQCEGIAWVGDDLLISNEDSTLFRIDSPLKVTRFPGIVAGK